VPEHPSLVSVKHRPWPLPSRPWAIRQTWHDLLFLHWPVASERLRPLVPQPLAIEEHSGSAWVAVTPFWMSGVAFRNLPPLPVLSRFEELNVRTYVSFGGRPGVWFFSLDADSLVAVQAARLLYRLPYVFARMSHRRAGDQVSYRSSRQDGTGFAARYGPTGPVEGSRPGTLPHWLTERYCLYAKRGAGPLHRAEIHHEPWPLQPASAELERNDLLAVHGIEAGGSPALLHFSRRLEVVVWPLERVTGEGSAGRG
jgi:uncharacterized protein YqjF (DUF2071 family)